jgi:hypothetical protein
LLGLLRCFYIYRQTPECGRIEAILSWHHPKRELEELERNPVTLRSRSVIEPAPHLRHTMVMGGHQRPPQRENYVEVQTSSPPDSPPSHVTPLATFNCILRQCPMVNCFLLPNSQNLTSTADIFCVLNSRRAIHWVEQRARANGL